MRKTMTYNFVWFGIGFALVAGVCLSNAAAQSKTLPLGKDAPGRNIKTRAIPLVVVRPLPTLADIPGFGGALEGRGFRRTTPPAALSPDVRTRMLRDSGFDFKPGPLPREVRLSPHDPIASSSAYLFFRGDVEYNAASDSLFLNIVESPFPRFGIPGLPDWGSASGGPQPDPPGIVGVLLRLEPRARYLADFTASSDQATSYHVTVTGVEGSGRFERAAGTQHVLAVLESNEGGYARIGFWCGRSFTFHNVVISRID